MPFDARRRPGTFRRVWDNGERAALALHCALGNGRGWDGLARALPLRLTAIDLPGHGQSDDWSGSGDYHALCTAVAKAFCTGPTDLIGHSFGATVALRVAVERPDLVRSLTLVEPVFFAAARADDAPELAAHDAAFAPFADAIRAGDAERAARVFTGFWGGGASFDTLPPARRDRLIARIPLIPAGHPAIGLDNAGLLQGARLHSLNIPALLVRGADSPPVMGAIHRALMSRLPDVREVVIPAAGHMVALTRQDRIAAAMKDRFRL